MTEDSARTTGESERRLSHAGEVGEQTFGTSEDSRPMQSAQSETEGKPVRLQPEEDPHLRLSRMKARAREWETSEQWGLLYEGLSIDELRSTRNAIEDQILELTTAEMEIMFSEGRYELLSEDGIYASSHFNPYDVYWVRIVPELGVIKATLPEGRFLDVYNLRAHSAWLSDRIRTLGGQP